MNKLLLTDSELKDIVLRYGSPLYLFYENEFRANFAHLCEVFRAVYKNYIPAYSYKTNYTPYVCGIVKEMGGYAEVVSDMELYLAKKIGYNHSQIFYNGPCKGKMLEEHLLAGGISNIDNEDEAKRMIMKVDKARLAYHKKYAGYTPYDPLHKHLMIDSSLLGIEGTADMIAELIKRKFKDLV